MMNVKVTDAGCFVEGSGSGEDMIFDICVIINEVYSLLHKHNPSDARAFRTLLSGLMADPCSPIWEPSSGSDGICISVPVREEGDA